MVAAPKSTEQRCPRCKRTHFDYYATCEQCRVKKNRNRGHVPQRGLRLPPAPVIGKIVADPLGDEWIAYDKQGHEMARTKREPKGVLRLFAKLYGTEAETERAIKKAQSKRHDYPAKLPRREK